MIDERTGALRTALRRMAEIDLEVSDLTRQIDELTGKAASLARIRDALRDDAVNLAGQHTDETGKKEITLPEGTVKLRVKKSLKVVDQGKVITWLKYMELDDYVYETIKIGEVRPLLEAEFMKGAVIDGVSYEDQKYWTVTPNKAVVFMSEEESA